MNDVMSWVALPGSSGIVLRGIPVGPEHLTLLHRWAAEPHLTPWWDLTGPASRLQAHLDGVRLSGGHPWLVVEGDVPFAYVETYTVAEDPFGDALAVAGFEVDDHDLGWHVFIGRPEQLGRPVNRLMARAVLAAAFVTPGVERMWCEPDVRNERMIRFCESVGFERLADVDLADKRAAVLSVTRSSFQARWHDDVASVRMLPQLATAPEAGSHQ